MIKLPFIFLICLTVITSQVTASPHDFLGDDTLVCNELVSVYDGDTFRCNIDGIHPLLGENIGIRINGVDTPEMRDKRIHVKSLALKAKHFALHELRSCELIELRNVKRGKYFRIVADVYVDGINLGKLLIQNGLGKPYGGGRKSKW